jgi:deoxyribose-phosphate aldolase
MSVNITAAPLSASVTNDWRNAAKLIDHTLLKPDATPEQVAALCADAVQYGFFLVMVNPANVALASAHVRGTSVRVGTVVGFPLGANLTVTKVAEAEAVLRHGAHELDMVINVGALKSGNRTLVQTEMQVLAQFARGGGAVLKVILETALLTQEEKILACALAMEAGADFVKTSTGFAGSEATVRDVALMRGVVGHKLGVKAAGGIRTLAQFIDMVDAGANRIGASASVDIMRELGAAAEE